MSDLITGLAVASFNQALSPVLVSVDFGAATSVSAIDITDAVLAGDPVSDVLKVQHSPDDVTWTDFGIATLGGGARSRRFAAAPGAMIARRYWRVVIAKPAEADGKAVSIASVRFLRETSTLSGARVAPHSVSETAAYVHILSDKSSDIYSGGQWVGAAATPYISSIMGSVDFTTDADLLLMFHGELPPHRLFRQGAADEWDSRSQAFREIPNIQFSDTVYTNGVDEVQQITFEGYANGETFNITFDGETSSTITYSSVAATTAANIKAALEALDAMGGGTVTVADLTGGRFSITFQGEAGQYDWPEIAASVVNSASGIVTTATLTEGEEGGEPVASLSRGWWVTGDFENERLVLGGPKSAPKILNASMVGDPFCLSSPGRRATDGVMVSISAGNIRQITSEDFLQVFTDTRALSLRATALLGDDDNPIKPDGPYGLQNRLRPQAVDGATLIVQAGGRVVVELRYDDGAKKYLGTPVSDRAPELVTQPVDLFSRPAGYGFECDALFLPLAAGGITVYQSLRERKFHPLARYATQPGYFIAGGTEERGPTYVVTERTINEQVVRYVEGFDVNCLLDCAIVVDLPAPAATLPVAHLEGCEVWAVGSDGYFYGPFMVADGVVARADGEDFPAASYEIGLWFDAHVDPMPIAFDTTSGDSIADRPKQVAEVVVSLLNSTPPELVYMGRARNFPGQRFADDILDAPPMQNLITDRLKIDRLRGWSVDPQIRLRRRWPGPFTIRSLALTVLWSV